jgi:MFS superfamily sulfate permease-like transporter
MANISAPANFVELFTPKLVTVLREGYGVRDLKADIVAALTVAIVALPLSMAIAIASGVFAGEVVDLLGLQLSGPEPGPIVPKFTALYGALPTVNPGAVSIALLSIAAMVLLRIGPLI